MVVTDTLKTISFSSLLETFNEAFSSYDVPVSMTMDQLVSHTDSIGYRKEDSMGLFDQGRLVGFLLVGRRGSLAYDGATGIISSYQGKGLAHLLIDATLEHLKSNGVETFILEVIDTNTRARELYRKHGFSDKRSLLCYKIETQKLLDKEQRYVRLVDQTSITLQKGDCVASWQNNNESVVQGAFRVMDIVAQEQKRGYVCFNQIKGSIAQIYINEHDRSQGFAQNAIIELSKHATTPSLSMLNVDKSYLPMQALLQKSGFSLFLTQTEMEKQL